MFYILTTASLFLDLGNENFCQATGRAIYDMKPLGTLSKRFNDAKRLLPQDFEDKTGASKRQRVEQGANPNGSMQYANRMVKFVLSYQYE
jgi:hypothetical protein